MAAMKCRTCGNTWGYYGGARKPCIRCAGTPFENGTLATLTYLEYQRQDLASIDMIPIEKDCFTIILAGFPEIEATITDERRKKILELVCQPRKYQTIFPIIRMAKYTSNIKEEREVFYHLDFKLPY